MNYENTIFFMNHYNKFLKLFANHRSKSSITIKPTKEYSISSDLDTIFLCPEQELHKKDLQSRKT